MAESTNRTADDRAITDTIERLLQARRPDATICPSEVARDLIGDDGPWRAAMPALRAVAATMVEAGRLRVTRRGVDVEATSPGGPIRLGRQKPSRPTGD
jgi:hypothetical protein